MTQTNYKDWKLKDFQDHYNENHKGKSRSEVFKENQYFYKRVLQKGFLDDVFPKPFTKFSLKELQDFYRQNHKGKTRLEIQKKAPGFYSEVRNRSSLDEVLPEDKRGQDLKSYKGWELEDFQNYYKENHNGKSRSEVEKEDNSFYFAVLRRKFTGDVFPPKQSGRKPKLELIVE